MMIHDAAGSIVVVSAESVKMAGEGCIVINARAVYVHNQSLTSGQAAIVKHGIATILDDPEALEKLKREHGISGVDLPPRHSTGVDGDGMDAHIGESDRLDKTPVGPQPLSELADRCGCGSCHGQRRGRSQVKNEVERCFVAHCSSFLRCLKGLVCCAITSLSLRRKEPNRPSMNQGAVK